MGPQLLYCIENAHHSSRTRMEAWQCGSTCCHGKLNVYIFDTNNALAYLRLDALSKSIIVSIYMVTESHLTFILVF